jgi:hypothetical protein
MSKQLKSAQKYAETARDWEAKNDANWATRNYGSAVLNYLSYAVTECDAAERGTFLLREYGVGDLLASYTSCAERLAAQVAEGALPLSVLGGNYVRLAFCHVQMLLGGTPDRLLRIAAQADEASPPFWQAYRQCFAQLVNHEEVLVPALQLKGAEKYWAPYLDLMSVLSRHGDVDPLRERVIQVFEARNADKSFRDDAYRIEGSPSHPVKWDFRLDGLLAFIA